MVTLVAVTIFVVDLVSIIWRGVSCIDVIVNSKTKGLSGNVFSSGVISTGVVLMTTV